MHSVTDRRTDGQTTYDSNTALCTKVHRAVKNPRSATVIILDIIIINVLCDLITLLTRKPSRAIAKMTARCALYMGALKILENH